MKISVDFGDRISRGVQERGNLETLAGSVFEQLAASYENLGAKASFSGTFGMYKLDGYAIGERTCKEPRTALVGVARGISNRDMRDLVYVGNDRESEAEQALHVYANEQPVIEACQIIAENRPDLSVRYVF